MSLVQHTLPHTLPPHLLGAIPHCFGTIPHLFTTTGKKKEHSNQTHTGSEAALLHPVGLTSSTPAPSCGSQSLALRGSRAATCGSPVLRCESARLGTFVGPTAVGGRACSDGPAPALRTCRTVEMTLCAFCSIDTAVPIVATLTVYFTGVWGLIAKLVLYILTFLEF